MTKNDLIEILVNEFSYIRTKATYLADSAEKFSYDFDTLIKRMRLGKNRCIIQDSDYLPIPNYDVTVLDIGKNLLDLGYFFELIEIDGVIYPRKEISYSVKTEPGGRFYRLYVEGKENFKGKEIIFL